MPPSSTAGCRRPDGRPRFGRVILARTKPFTRRCLPRVHTRGRLPSSSTTTPTSYGRGEGEAPGATTASRRRRVSRAGGPQGSPPDPRVRLPRMRLEGIKAGDIVEVDRLGRRFHALVDGSADGGLSIQPLDRRVTYRTCRPHEVRAHWAKRGRTRVTSEPLGPSPLQLEIDTAVRDPTQQPERHER
jgi:hypothetical protein